MEGECEVETGRNIGADLIISEMLKLSRRPAGTGMDRAAICSARKRIGEMGLSDVGPVVRLLLGQAGRQEPLQNRLGG